jgi:hypothetical protein
MTDCQIQFAIGCKPLRREKVEIHYSITLVEALKRDKRYSAEPWECKFEAKEVMDIYQKMEKKRLIKEGMIMNELEKVKIGTKEYLENVKGERNVYEPTEHNTDEERQSKKRWRILNTITRDRIGILAEGCRWREESREGTRRGLQRKKGFQIRIPEPRPPVKTEQQGIEKVEN